MHNTVTGLAAAAAIVMAGSTLSASACPYHEGYGGYGHRGEYGRGEYRREFDRREYPRQEYRRGEYRQEFEPRREYGRSEYSRRSGYGEYRD